MTIVILYRNTTEDIGPHEHLRLGEYASIAVGGLLWLGFVLSCMA